MPWHCFPLAAADNHRHQKLAKVADGPGTQRAGLMTLAWSHWHGARWDSEAAAGGTARRIRCESPQAAKAHWHPQVYGGSSELGRRGTSESPGGRLGNPGEERPDEAMRQ